VFLFTSAIAALDIKNLLYVEQEVGKHIKSSKVHFIWEFMLDNKAHKIELYDSKLSGKKKVIKDGQVFAEVEDDFAFSKTFDIGKHSCTIIQHGEKYELRVDNQSFNHMCDLERNKVFFSSSNPTSFNHVSKPVSKEGKIDFGMGNGQTSQKGEEKQVNFFAIKPVTINGSNNNTNKRFTIDSNSFVNNHNNNKVAQTKTDNNLIDFGVSVSNVNMVNTVPQESKANTFALFSLDFERNNVNNVSNINKNIDTTNNTHSEINYPQFHNTQFQNTPYNFSVPKTATVSTQSKTVSNDPLADLFG